MSYAFPFLLVPVFSLTSIMLYPSIVGYDVASLKTYLRVSVVGSLHWIHSIGSGVMEDFREVTDLAGILCSGGVMENFRELSDLC